jgi:hypothetical protein
VRFIPSLEFLAEFVERQQSRMKFFLQSALLTDDMKHFSKNMFGNSFAKPKPPEEQFKPNA